MGCCCGIDGIADHMIVHAALGVGSGGGSGTTEIRRDVIANIGTASDYATDPWFLEDRSLLPQESDVLYVRMYNGAAWVWVELAAAPPTSGGSPWG